MMYTFPSKTPKTCTSLAVLSIKQIAPGTMISSWTENIGSSWRLVSKVQTWTTLSRVPIASQIGSRSSVESQHKHVISAPVDNLLEHNSSKLSYRWVRSQ